LSRLEIDHFVFAHQFIQRSSDQILLVDLADIFLCVNLEIFEHTKSFDVVEHLHQSFCADVVSVKIEAEFLKIFVFCEASDQGIQTTVSHFVAVEAQAQFSDAREGFQTRCKVLIIVLFQKVPIRLNSVALQLTLSDQSQAYRRSPLRFAAKHKAS
jgi:hypothetical protein